MAILTADMKQVIAEQAVGYVATASKDGIPNVSPKGTLRVIDDDNLAFACVMSQKTIDNLKANPNIAVAVANPAAFKGFQFKGKVTLESSGPLFDEMAAAVVAMKLPKPSCIAMIKVTSVFSTPPGR